MNTETAAPLESTIEDHIAATSKLVRQVDTALALSAVFSFLLGGTFLAVLADHWFCTDGLSLFMRFGIFTALAAAAGLYTFYRIIPLYRRPINPVYTADLIEQSAPSFKNSLINWLLIRREREVRRTAAENKIAERMFDGVVRSAAVSVHSVPANHAVDFRQLIQAGTVLVLLLTAFIAYAAFSPKSPLASLARIILPFSSIEPPQAVQFRNVKPGNAVFLQGETAVISAEVIGRSSEPVYLVFSSDDGQAAGQRIPMQQFDGKAAFETVFPPGKQGNDRGFSCGIVYWIAQAGSKSPKYRIDVKPAASIEMTSLHYRYPAYTGLKNETVEHGGDIRALEGTEMTVAVRSTLPLKNIDIAFDGDPKQKIPMKLSNSNTEASVAFKLDLSKPHKTFVFQALDETGTPSRRSGIYRIEIIEDKPPFIQWADTAAELNNAAQIDLPENQTLTLPIQAEDPDFALRTIRLRIESDKGKEQIFLLESSPSGPTEHRGQIKRTAVFSPSEHPFRAGDDLEIYAEAEDTKLPHANRCETRKIKIKIVETKQEDSKNEKQKVPDKQNKQNTDEKQNGNEGKKGEEQKNGGEQNENPQAGDPDKNDPNQNPQNQQPPNEKNKQNDNEGNQNDPQQKPEPQAGQNQEGNQKGEQKGHQSGDSPQNGNQPENSKDGNSGDPSPDRGENNAAAAASDTEGNTKGNAGDGVKAGENVDDANRKGQTGDGRESGSNPSDSAAQGGQGNGEKSKGGSDSNHRTQQEAESGVNPETQDGDAMEKMVDHMKEQGKFDENRQPARREQPADAKDQDSRQRDNSLDPNSPNRTNKGNDPGDPQKSETPGEGQQSGKPDKGNQAGESGEGQQSGKPDKGNQTGKSSEGQQSGKPDKGNQTGESSEGQQSGKPDKGNQAGESGEGQQSGQSDKGNRAGESGEGQQSGKPDKGNQAGESGEGQQSGKPDKGNQAGESGEGQQSGKPDKGNQAGESGEGQQSGHAEREKSAHSTAAAEEGGKSSAAPTGGNPGGGSDFQKETAADDPNLQYTEKATNLVLEYLEEQLKNKPDEELLKKLGWTEAQLRQFYDKWNKMSAEGQRPQAGKPEKDTWLEALKSLGLRPNKERQALQGNQTKVKDKNKAAESLRYEPPAAIKDKFRHYTEGIGK